MRDITGSIVVYKNPSELIRKAMASFLDTELDVRLYVVDNSPNDRAREVCGNKRVTYIFNGKNLGFGAGHNIALRRAVNEAPYHVVLNPDVYFSRGVLEGLLEFATRRTEVGLLMPKVLNPNGTIQHLCKRLPKPSDLILRRFLPAVFRPLVEGRLRRYELRDQDYNRLLRVPVLSGCFMMLSRAALSEAGLFDERYFLYMEDVDLCRRIGQRFKTVYFPEVAIYHHYGKGSYRSMRLMMHHVASAVRYFHKWGWFSDAERARINEKEPSATFALGESD